ncbi:MAG: hypothetical protein PHU65_07165 [Actinomycetota bacterium]|nr:hypothetical protein [Actinomycetota bacterium]
MENELEFNDKSVHEFDNARFKSMLLSLRRFLVGRNNELLSFEKIKKNLRLYNQRNLGIQTIRIRDIVGSLDRYKDFDSYFLPKKMSLQRRWANIHNLLLKDVILPPVKLHKVGEVYFVFDGNHRVSVSKKMGVEFIDAEVIEFITDVKIKAGMDPNQIFVIAEREKFLNITGLKQERPDNKMRVTAPGQYDFLLGQIDKLMVQINENKKTGEKLMTFKEASLFWYDNVYLPAIEIIKKYGILQKFPKRTKTDLYIWINEHKRYLSLKYGREIITKFAAKDIIDSYSKNPFNRVKLKFINIGHKKIKYD